MSDESRMRLYHIQQARDELNMVPRAYEQEHIARALTHLDMAIKGWPATDPGAPAGVPNTMAVPPLAYVEMNGTRLSVPTITLSLAQAEEMGLLIVRKAEAPPG